MSSSVVVVRFTGFLLIINKLYDDDENDMNYSE